MTTALSHPLLAFDTSTPTARVALLSADGTCLAAREKTAARHSANLLILCDEVLREGKVRVGELGSIACGAGPGSFTGLRVGLAVAKGLALPTGLPLLLVSSLDALACDLDDRTAPLLLPCIDAGKGQIYARIYRAGSSPQNTLPCALGDNDWVLAPGSLCELVRNESQGQPILLGGTGVDRYLDIFRSAFPADQIVVTVPGPSATSVGCLAALRIQRGEFDDLDAAVPRYGRPPDITRSKKPLLAG